MPWLMWSMKMLLVWYIWDYNESFKNTANKRLKQYTISFRKKINQVIKVNFSNHRWKYIYAMYFAFLRVTYQQLEGLGQTQTLKRGKLKRWKIVRLSFFLQLIWNEKYYRLIMFWIHNWSQFKPQSSYHCRYYIVKISWLMLIFFKWGKEERKS